MKSRCYKKIYVRFGEIKKEKYFSRQFSFRKVTMKCDCFVKYSLHVWDCYENSLVSVIYKEIQKID